ncbi:hypothetical protein cyc_04570 [Cyclospora cayetanensis]|uniref:Protein kinase domain-containing protein n=1 Tax=Cyclospora cayetanensis TaxID=88456 RepID=A0A1D3CUP5_9EIME|nr:hypothetical protein cyc_04570 [Cyclospora cayetanensis]
MMPRPILQGPTATAEAVCVLPSSTIKGAEEAVAAGVEDATQSEWRWLAEATEDFSEEAILEELPEKEQEALLQQWLAETSQTARPVESPPEVFQVTPPASAGVSLLSDDDAWTLPSSFPRASLPSGLLAVPAGAAGGAASVHHQAPGQEALWEVTPAATTKSGSLVVKKVAIDGERSMPAWLLRCICLAQNAAACVGSPHGAQGAHEEPQDGCAARLLLPVYDVHVASTAAYFVVEGSARCCSLAGAVLRRSSQEALRCSCGSGSDSFLRTSTHVQSPKADAGGGSTDTSSSAGPKFLGWGCVGCPRRFLWLLLCGLAWLRALRLLPSTVSPSSVYLRGPCPLRLYLAVPPLTPDVAWERGEAQQQPPGDVSWLAHQLPPSCWVPPERRAAEAAREAQPSATCSESRHETHWGPSCSPEDGEAAVVWGVGVCLLAHLLLQQHGRQTEEAQPVRVQRPKQRAQPEARLEALKREDSGSRRSLGGRLSVDAAAADEVLWPSGESLALRRRRSCGLPEDLLLLQQEREGAAAAVAAASQELVDTCEGTSAGDAGQLPASLLAAASEGAAPFMVYEANGELSSSSLLKALPQLATDPLGLRLLQLFLHAAPRARISLDDALSHPWFQEIRADIAAAGSKACSCGRGRGSSSDSTSREGEWSDIEPKRSCAAAEWVSAVARASQRSSAEAAQGEEWLLSFLDRLGLSPSRTGSATKPRPFETCSPTACCSRGCPLQVL